MGGYLFPVNNPEPAISLHGDVTSPQPAIGAQSLFAGLVISPVSKANLRSPDIHFPRLSGLEDFVSVIVPEGALSVGAQLANRAGAGSHRVRVVQ